MMPATVDTDKDTTYHLVGSNTNIEGGFQFELTTPLAATDTVDNTAELSSDAAQSNAIANNNNSSSNSVMNIDNPMYLRVLVMALGMILGTFLLFMAFFMTLMLPMLGDSGEFDFHVVGFVLLWLFWMWRLGIAVLVNAFQYARNQNGQLSKLLKSLGGLLCRGCLTLLLYVAIDWVLTRTLDFLLLAAPFQLLARWYASVRLADLAIKRTVLVVAGRMLPATTTTSITTWMPFQQHCRKRRDGILSRR